MARLKPEDLIAFTGDLVRFRHGLWRNILCTPGVQYVAEHGQAYWLLDAIAVQINSQRFRRMAIKYPAIDQMHFWKLAVASDRRARLIAQEDSGLPPFIVQDIEWTDFPLSSLDISAAYDGECWTLYLPSEH